MNDADSKKIKFKELIAKDLGRAIVIIQREIEHNSPFYNDIIRNMRRYFKVERDFEQGVVKMEERDRVFNQITNSLISIIDDLEGKDLIELNKIQKEVEEFHEKMKEYEENPNSLKAVIKGESENIRTFLIAGVNSLENVSEKITELTNHVSQIEQNQEVSEKNLYQRLDEILVGMQRIVRAFEHGFKFQEKAASNIAALSSNSNENMISIREEVSYVIQKQTQIYQNMIENLIDNSTINNERLIAALDSLKNKEEE